MMVSGGRENWSISYSAGSSLNRSNWPGSDLCCFRTCRQLEIARHTPAGRRFDRVHARKHLRHSPMGGAPSPPTEVMSREHLGHRRSALLVIVFILFTGWLLREICPCGPHGVGGGSIQFGLLSERMA
jgi:hypothetical protein